jgi:hypothetical protein
MAHFAKVVNGVVENVIVAEPDFFNSFVDDSPGEWIQTSYNTRGGVHYDPETGEPSDDQSKALRVNYASPGGTYDAVRDAFIPPKPFSSWLLNEETLQWYPPVDYPGSETTSNEGDTMLNWDEENQQWIECDSCTI